MLPSNQTNSAALIVGEEFHFSWSRLVRLLTLLGFARRQSIPLELPFGFPGRIAAPFRFAVPQVRNSEIGHDVSPYGARCWIARARVAATRRPSNWRCDPGRSWSR